MGLITKVVGKLFGGGGKPSVTIPQPAVKASELLPSTNAKAPEAPTLGTTTERKGRKSLMIDRTRDNTNYHPTNM